MTEPYISSHAYDIAVVGLMLGAFGAIALGYAAERLIEAARKFRSADLGDKLLDACAGDRKTAEKSIDSIRLDNAVLVEAASYVLASECAEFRARRAQFNAACQEDEGGIRRWQDVQ